MTLQIKFHAFNWRLFSTTKCLQWTTRIIYFEKLVPVKEFRNNKEIHSLFTLKISVYTGICTRVLPIPKILLKVVPTPDPNPTKYFWQAKPEITSIRYYFHLNGRSRLAFGECGLTRKYKNSTWNQPATKKNIFFG